MFFKIPDTDDRYFVLRYFLLYKSCSDARNANFGDASMNFPESTNLTGLAELEQCEGNTIEALKFYFQAGERYEQEGDYKTPEWI